MARESDAAGVSNPFLLWTDMGMRAAEMTLAAMQDMTDGADRLARANASAEVDVPPVAAPGLGGIADIQRLYWDLMTQNWLRWASMYGALLSAGAGVTLARKMAGQENPLRAFHDGLRRGRTGRERSAAS